MKKLEKIIFILMALISGNVVGQITDQIGDYGVWEEIHNVDISNDGKWIQYKSNYQSVPDTITVASTWINKSYKIPKGIDGAFTLNSNFFTAYVDENRLQIINLKTDSISFLNNVFVRNISFDENYIIARSSNDQDIFSLSIKNLSTNETNTIQSVVEYTVNPIKNKVAFEIQENNKFFIKILNFETNEVSEVLQTETGMIKSLTWSENGTMLSFLEPLQIGGLESNNLYSFSGNICKKMAMNSASHKFENLIIQENYVDVSYNGDYVYFKGINKDRLNYSLPKEIQIWDTKDKWIYPMRKMNNMLAPQSDLYYWNTEDNNIQQVTDSVLPDIIKVNPEFILVYNKLEYEPQYKYEADVDLYLHDLKIGKNNIFLKKQNPNQVFVSPNGNTIVYFRDRDWWMYNMENKKNINLTSNLLTSFYNSQADRESKKRPFCKRIKWVEGEDAIIVNDEYDIWKLNFNGQNHERLTCGREKSWRYSTFVDFLNPKNIAQNVVDLKKGFLINAVDNDTNSGYFYWQPNSEIIEIVSGKAKVDEIKWDSEIRFFTYRIQDYDMPSQIKLFDRTNSKTINLVDSNKNKTIKDWGKPTLIEFKMDDGSPSKASLIYPVNYDSNKKYPMIVQIYEKQTTRMHEFYPISWFSEVGFNPAHYTLDGYFVLQPDINYEIGNPGLSALKYVERAVEYTVQNFNVDSAKIGLLGHSFGGYETTFIITKTNMFATAVAGSAPTNLVEKYTTVEWSIGQEKMWFMEDHQFRMKGSYFNYKEQYLNNSPFHNIENVSTPLLLWSGDKDDVVDFKQSVSFYLSLRRLEKTAKLLLFENEEHQIFDMEKRIYLSNYIKKWFDSYCK